jgi:gluconolactonase
MTDFGKLSMTLVADNLGFPEGPVALPDGSVAVVEIESHSVARIARDGSIRRYDVGKGPNGMAIGPDGAAYVGTDGGLKFAEKDGQRFPIALADDYAGGSLQRLDLETGDLRTIITEADGNPIGGSNDIVFDHTGSCYMVDTAGSRLLYLDPLSGRVSVAKDDLALPNGMGLSPDGLHLYVSESFAGGILRFPVISPGQLGEKELLFTNGGDHGWDGLAIDAAGNICVAALHHSCIRVISPEGLLIGDARVPLDDNFVTNICFGGHDMTTAWICSAARGRLYRLTWPWPGLRLHNQAT